MTHPTEPNIKERLAAALWKHDGHAAVTAFNPRQFDDAPPDSRLRYLRRVDAILAELENPSEGMKTAAAKVMGVGDNMRVWSGHRAMIQHIRDGGQ